MRHRDGVCRAAIVAVFACSGSVAHAGEVADSPAAQVDRIFEKYASSSAPGCAVGVFEGGKLTLFRGYGVANVDDRKAVSQPTPCSTRPRFPSSSPPLQQRCSWKRAS